MQPVLRVAVAVQALTQTLSKLRTKMTHQEKENGGKGEDILVSAIAVFVLGVCVLLSAYAESHTDNVRPCFSQQNTSEQPTQGLQHGPQSNTTLHNCYKHAIGMRNNAIWAVLRLELNTLGCKKPHVYWLFYNMYHFLHKLSSYRAC